MAHGRRAIFVTLISHALGFHVGWRCHSTGSKLILKFFATSSGRLNTLGPNSSKAPVMETPSSSTIPSPGISTKKVILIILGVILVTGGIAVATTAWWVKHTLYPSPMKPVTLTATEQAAFDSKLQTLSAPPSAPASAPVVPQDPELAKRTLVITEREVNAYLAKQNLGESVEVNFSEGQVSAAIILTAPQDFPLLSGQKVRMRLTFGTSLNPGQKLSFILDDVSLGGISLPNAWLADLKGVDLIAKNIQSDPGLQRFLAGIQQLEIHSGEMRVLLNK